MKTTTETLNFWKTTVFKNNINDFLRNVLQTDVPSVPRQYLSKELSPTIQLNSFTISDSCMAEGGDFFLMAEKNGESLIFMGDAMGHGSYAARHAEELLRVINQTIKKLTAGSASNLMKYCNFLFHISNTNWSPFFNRTADMIISRIDHDTLTLSYCSARINFLLVRDGKAFKLEKDKNFIGNISDTTFDVKTHVVNLMKGDLLFMHTDGVVDQFGGISDKKLGRRKLIEFLESQNGFELKQVETNVRSFLFDWRGGRERTDDMTLIGILI